MAQSSQRRTYRPKVTKRIVVDGTVVRPGESLPRSVSLKDTDRLRAHGFVQTRKGSDWADG